MAAMPTVEEFREFFLNEYEAAAPEIEATEVIPDRLLERAADLGAYRLTLPVEHGGWGLPVLDYLPYLEAAAMGPGSGRMLVHVTNGVWRPLAQFGDESQQAVIANLATGDVVLAFCLTEKTGGTGRDTRSRAVADGDDWLLTGEKHLITFADRADLFLIVAASDDRTGQGLPHRVPRPSRHDRLRDRRHPAHDGPPRDRTRAGSGSTRCGCPGPAASARSVRGWRWR